MRGRAVFPLCLLLLCLGGAAMGGSFAGSANNIVPASVNIGGGTDSSTSNSITGSVAEVGASAYTSSSHMLQAGFPALAAWPDTILNLSASTGAAAGSISLGWTAPRADGSTGTAAAYEVHYSTLSSAAPGLSESQFLLARSVTDYVSLTAPLAFGSTEQLNITGLEGGTTYYFAVKARAAWDGWSYVSNAGTAEARAYQPVFSAFTDAAGDFISLAWAPNGNGAGAGYRVLVSTAADPLAPAGAVVTSSDVYGVAFSTSGLRPNTIYYFRIAGLNRGQVTTAYTAAASTATHANIPVFSGFAPVAAGSLQFNWTANGNSAGTLYRVLTSTAPDPLAPAGAAVVSSDTYNLYLATSGLAANTTYYFRAAGINAFGTVSGYTAVYATATLANSPVFSSFTGVATGAMQFNWSANSNPSGTMYRVYASTAADPLAPAGALVTSSDTYNVALATSGLTSNTTYYFRAAAVNRNGVWTSYTAAQGMATLAAAPLASGFTSVAAAAMQFNWSANSNPAGTLYRVYSSTAADPLNPGGAVAVSSDTYNVYLATSGLAANTTYYFSVGALNRAGTATAYTSAVGTSTLLAYVPAAVNFTGLGAGAMQFNWSHNGNAAGTLYRVFVSTAADPLAPLGAVVTSSETYNVSLASSGLAANTTYYFRVAGVNNNNVATAYTAASATSTLAAAPLAAGFTAVAESSLQLNLTANSNPSWTRYLVLSSTAPDPLAPAGAVTFSSYTYNLSLSSSGLAANTTYYFRAAAVNNNGVLSAYTAAQATSTLANAPVFSAFSGLGVTAVNFAWTGANPAGTLYRVYSSTAADPLNPGYAAAASSDTYALSLSTAGLSPNTTYYFRAAAVNSNGVVTAYSSAQSTSTLAAAPLAAGFTDIGYSSAQFSLNGNGNPAGTLYRIYVSTAADPLAPAGALATSSSTYSLSLSSTGLTANTTYYFRAAAVNNAGTVTSYTAALATSTLLAYAPSFTAFSGVSTGSVRAAWTSGGNPAGIRYRVSLSTAPDLAADPGAPVISSDTYNLSFSTGYLPANTTYYFRVAGLNNNTVPSAYTALQSTSTMAAAPSFDGFPYVSDGDVKFAWLANGNDYPGTTYRVLYSTATNPLAPAGAAVVTADVTNLNFYAEGLASQTTYYFRVAAIGNDNALTSYTAAQSTVTTNSKSTILYLLTTAASVGTNSLQMARQPGSTVTTYTKSTVTGAVTPPTTATQFTATAGGSVVTWYTYPLDAVTIASSVTFNLWARESATAANATITAELLRADGAGNVLSSISTCALRKELTTAVAKQNWSPASVTPTALSNGDRLAVRLYIDDGTGVTMTSGRTVTMTLGGPTSGASGDSWIWIQQSLAPAKPSTAAITSVQARALGASWALVEGATGYTLAAAVSPDYPPSAFYASSDTYSTTSALVDTPVLVPNTAHYLYVRSNAYGASSGWAAYPGTSTLLAYPPAASGFGAVASASLRFDWDANGNANPGTQYRVFVSTAADPLAPAGAAVTSAYTYNLYYSTSGLGANTTYYFRVAGVNNDNVPTAYTEALGTSTLLAYDPAQPRFSGVWLSSVQFSWNSGGNAAGTLYRVYSSTAADPLAPAGAAAVSSDTYSLSLSSAGLPPNTAVYFRAAGVNNNNVETGYTAAAGTYTLAAQPLPSGFSGVTAEALRLAWGAAGNPDGTLYRVLSSTAADPLAPAGAAVVSSDTYNVYLDSAGLSADTTYYFRAAAINSDGVRTGYSAVYATATLLAFAPSASGFSGVASSAMQFNWVSGGNASGTRYRVLVSTAADPLAPAGAVVSSSDTYNLYLATSGLTADTFYYFRVAGVSKNGVLTAYTAAQGQATPLAYAPAASGFSGVWLSSAQFNWASGGNASGTLYRVAVSTAADPLSPGAAVATSSDTYNLYLSSAGLSPNTTYYFRVAGLGKGGTLTSYTAAYGTSTLAAVPSALDFTGIASTTIRMDWDSSGNGPGTLYRVVLSTAADPLAPAGAKYTTHDTYSLYMTTAGLTAYTQYNFRAASRNNNGLFSAYSAVASTRTLQVGVLAAPVAGAMSVFPSSITADWSLVSGATAYLLAASTGPGTAPAPVIVSSSTPGARASLTGLTPNTSYFLFVRASNDSTASAWSDYGGVYTLLAYPPAFSAFSGVGTSAAVFGWSANGNAASTTLYRVLVSTAANPLAPAGAAVTSHDTYSLSLSTSGLDADTTYYFRAAGVNNDGVLTAYTAAQSTATAANAPAFQAFSGVTYNSALFGWSGGGNTSRTLYRVLVSTAADPLAPAGAAVTQHDVYGLSLSTSGLSSDTTYYFRAAALGNNGYVTAYSAAASTATPLAYAPLAAGFSGVGVSSAQFNWNANGNAAGTLYRVLYSTAADPLSPGGAAVTSSFTYNTALYASGLSYNAAYYFRVAGAGKNGLYTAYTAAASTYTLAAAPVSAVSTFSAVTDSGFTAAWNSGGNPAGTLYTVGVSTAQDFNAGAAYSFSDSTAPVYGTSYAFTGLNFSTTYYFRVRAVNDGGSPTAYTLLGSTRTLGLQAPSPLPVAAVTAYSITAPWELAAGATGYTLAASLNGGGEPSPVAASSATANAYAVLPGLAVNTTYYLFVRSYGRGETSDWAAYPATSTLANQPAAAGTTFSNVSFNSFSAAWDANGNPLGSTRYQVQVSTAYDFNAGASDQVTFATAPAYGPGAEFTGLNVDTYYYFRVRALYNNGGASDWLSPGVAKTKALPVIHSAGDGVLFYGQSGSSTPQFRNYYSASNSFSAVGGPDPGTAGSLYVIKTNPLTSKQEAVAGYVSNGTLHVLCTDGTNWSEDWTQYVGGDASTRRFDIAYETNTGDVMVLYSQGVSGTNELGYRTKPGASDCGAGSWSAHTDLDPARTSGTVQWVKMASDPRSAYGDLAAVWADSNSDLSAMVWNGSAWENEPASALETSLEYVTSSQDVDDFAVQYESLSGDIMVVWANSAGANGTNGVRYAAAAWTGGSPLHTWGSVTTPATFADDATNLELAANPASNEMVFASLGNAGSDLQLGYWSGTAWTNTANVDTSAGTPLAGTKLVAAAWVSSGTYTRSVVAYNDSATTNIGWYVGNGGTFTAQTDATPSPVFANPQKRYEMQQDPVNKDRLMMTVTDGASGTGRLFAKRLVMSSAAAFTWTNADGSAALETALSSPTVGGASFVYWPAPPTTTFEQSGYRFFANADSTDAGSPLASQDTMAVLPSSGTAFRLRELVHVGQVDLPVSGQGFKLQFAGRGDGTCDAPANGTPADYTDVTGATVIAYNDNASVADGAALTANANDPRHGAHTTVAQTYEEAAASTNTVAAVSRNQDAMWDFALKDNGASPGTSYCFKLVKADGSDLNGYGVYPEVMLQPSVYINEVYPSGSSAAEDWVELYNNTSSTVPLVGWKLQYVENTIALGGTANTVWTAQSSDAVNAYSTFTVTGLGADLVGGQSYHVKLLNNTGSVADQVQWPALSSGQSFARVADGDPSFFEIDPTPTPGYANAVSTDQLKIAEVAYGPADRQFVELFNSSYVSTRTLAGYRLRNAASSLNGLAFRFTRKIYPRDYALVDFSSVDNDGRSFKDVFGASGLSAAGDFLALENSSGSVVDAVTWESDSNYTRYNYRAEPVTAANFAPAGAAYSIIRQPAEDTDSGSDSADFAASAAATPGSRNNGAGGAAANTLSYPQAQQYAARRFPVTLRLGADASAGRGNNILFSRTGGSADARSPHLYRLADIGLSLSSLAAQTTVQQGLSFYDQDGYPLAAGAAYRITLNSDTGSASAPQVVLGTVTYDAGIHALSASTAAPQALNNATRAAMLRLDVTNNGAAAANGMALSTVTFKLLDSALSPLGTQQARNLFEALMLVRDSTSSGTYGLYEPSVDVSTVAYLPMASISLDSAGGSTLTVPAAYLPRASAAGASSAVFYVVFESTKDASAWSPNVFRVRLAPSGSVLADLASGTPQDFSASAQVETSSVTVITPAAAPAGTSWPQALPAAVVTQSPAAYYTNEGETAVTSAVYYGATDGVLRVRKKDGTVKWTYPTVNSAAIRTSPTVRTEYISASTGVYVYFADDSGDIYKLKDNDSSGALVWRKQLGVKVSSSIADIDTDAVMYFGASDSKVYCLSKTDGASCGGLWPLSVPAPVSGVMALDNRATVNTAWVGLEDGKLVAVQTADVNSPTSMQTGGTINSSPYLDARVASANNVVYFTSTDGKLYARVSSNLSSVPSGWTDYPVSGGAAIHTSPFATFAGTRYIFYGDDAGKLHKVDANGSSAAGWPYQAGGAIRSSPVWVPNAAVAQGGADYVYFGCDDGYIYAVNAASGQLRSGWPVATGGPVRSDIVIDPDTKTLIAASGDGKTYVLYIGE